MRWITFHSGYDFGYLLKLLTCSSLPANETEFFQLLKVGPARHACQPSLPSLPPVQPSLPAYVTIQQVALFQTAMGQRLWYLIPTRSFCAAPPLCPALPAVQLFFPQIFDIKYLMKFCDNLHGGLNKLAETLDVVRIGPQHQVRKHWQLCRMPALDACIWGVAASGIRLFTALCALMANQPAPILFTCRPAQTRCSPARHS